MPEKFPLSKDIVLFVKRLSNAEQTVTLFANCKYACSSVL